MPVDWPFPVNGNVEEGLYLSIGDKVLKLDADSGLPSPMSDREKAIARALCELVLHRLEETPDG